MELTTVWFVAIATLWTGYFVLMRRYARPEQPAGEHLPEAVVTY